MTRTKWMAHAAVVAAACWLGVTHGLRADVPVGDHDPGGEPDPARQCGRTTGTLRASPEAIKLGESVTLTWTTSRHEDCHVGFQLAGRDVDPQGSLTLQPMSDTVYVLLLRPEAKSKPIVRAKVRVELPKVVEIKGNGGEWVRLLVQAVGEAGKTVRLAENVDIDLSHREAIFVASGVTLTSEWPADPVLQPLQPSPATGAQPVLFHAVPRPSPTPGTPPLTLLAHGLPQFHGVVGQNLVSTRTPRKLGPRLFTRTKPRPLFLLAHSDNVRLYGFRLHGPHPGPAEGDDNLERGIMINSSVGVEIANMELTGWSGQAIYLVDDEVRMFNPDAVKIHHNFIHHNQHEGGIVLGGGNGYGVDVAAGAYAAIENNVFDFNRHAIAASGKPGTGYRAHRNLILRGGGEHGTVTNPHTHVVDVHGDQNCPDTPATKHIWNCGDAGDQFWFTENAFQFVADKAIKLRGVPRVEATIASNVFAHDSVGDAVELREQTRVRMGEGPTANRADISTYGSYGVCDFDGDGQDDLFLPTGRTWWFSSGGKMHWTYLKDATERIHEVGLGYFDGDRRCDVLAAAVGDRWEISSGGSGPWTSLPGTYPVPFKELRFADFSGDKITDVFRRAPDGQWWVVSPGRFDWRQLASSGFPLSELAFADVDGDGVTDVLGMNGGHWSFSRSGREPWRDLNRRISTALTDLLIGDVDGNGRADIVRFVPDGAIGSAFGGRWQVSWNGTRAWSDLAQVKWGAPRGHAVNPRFFIGRFDAAPGAEPLAVDPNRLGHLYDRRSGAVRRYSLYAY